MYFIVLPKASKGNGSGILKLNLHITLVVAQLISICRNFSIGLGRIFVWPYDPGIGH
jgi:hypothetical protein